MSTRFRRLGLLILAAGLVAAPALRAELAPATAVFNVVDEIITPPPVDPGGGNVIDGRTQPTAVAVDNGFAIAWINEKSLSGDDVMLSEVNGRLIDAAGNLGAIFEPFSPHVSPGVLRQSCPMLANLGGGRFQLAWAQKRISGRDVFVQSFLPNGAGDAWSTRFIGNSSPYYFGDMPSIAGRADGRSALAWSEVFREPQVGAVPTQRYNLLSFDAAGAPTTSALPLGSGRQSELQVRPAVTLDAAGVATVTWIEPKEGANPQGLGTLWSQRFAASGVPLTAKVRIALRATDGVALAGAANSQTILVWARKGQNGAIRLSVARQTANGRVIGKPKDLGLVTSFAQPVLLADAGGAYVLAWIDGERLKALHLGADLAKRGTTADVALARPNLYYDFPHGFGAALSNGRLLLVWEGEMPPASNCPGNAIKAQIFDLR
jgi:hypothetical protein